MFGPKLNEDLFPLIMGKREILGGIEVIKNRRVGSEHDIDTFRFD